MTSRQPDRSHQAKLVELSVADDQQAWADAGFTVTGGTVEIGSVKIRLIGANQEPRGIRSWTLAGLGPAAARTNHLDGLPTVFDTQDPSEPADLGGFVVTHAQPRPSPHANGVIGMDHIVVATPDLDRSVVAFENLQLPCRRIREVGGAHPMRQAFFRLGPTIVEVVGPPAGRGSSLPSDQDPSTWFGLALDVEDLDLTRQLLGDAMGRTKPAVQDGRRISTLGQVFNISVPIAMMDDHRQRVDPT